MAPLAVESNAGQRFIRPSVTRRLLPRWRVPHLVLGPNPTAASAAENRPSLEIAVPGPRSSPILAAPDEQDTIQCVLTFDSPPAGVIERPHQWRGGRGGASLWHRLKMPLKR